MKKQTPITLTFDVAEQNKCGPIVGTVECKIMDFIYKIMELSNLSKIRSTDSYIKELLKCLEYIHIFAISCRYLFIYKPLF